MKTKFIILTVIFFFFGCTQQTGVEDQKAELMNIDREFSRMSVEKGTFAAFSHLMAVALKAS